MVFQKDLTPFAKGGTVKKQRGKGGATFRPDPMAQATGRYPKAPPTPVVAPTAAMPPGPMGPLLPPEKI